MKITKVSKDTGISRTTLTSLANNYSQGVQFETLDSLCSYLKITPADFFSYSPFNVFINVDEKAKGDEIHIGKFSIQFVIKSAYGKTITEFSLPAEVKFSRGVSQDELDSEVETKFLNIVINVSDSDVNKYNYKRFVQPLPQLIKNEMEIDICNLVAIAYDYDEQWHTESYIVWN